MPIVYKICSAEEWRGAEQAGVFAGSAADRRDGFIHLSAPHQVRETARRHFGDLDGLVLVALDAARLGPSLRWEASRGGDRFPHLYTSLAVDAALSVVPLPWNGSAHEFPDGIA
ncbi:DUF952 domain-containing protein [soil metagenome]